jgi:hypothetical protein
MRRNEWEENEYRKGNEQRVRFTGKGNVRRKN